MNVVFLLRCFFVSAPGPFSMSKQDSVNAEERIAQILREAQNAMIQKNTDYTPQNNHRHQPTTQHNNNNNVRNQLYDMILISPVFLLVYYIIYLSLPYKTRLETN